MPVKGTYLAIAGGGGLLLWSGLAGKKWSTSLRDILSGKKPEATLTAYPITGTPQTASGGGPQGGPGPKGPVGGSRAKNLAIGKVLTARFGWSTGAEWAALVSLWDSESGWNNKIWNTSASCGGNAYAYGIPQACGHGVRKQTAHSGVAPFPPGNLGNPPEYGGVSSATAQIWWGLKYIKANYGSPVHVPHGGY